jgi:hypothetical protein
MVEPAHKNTNAPLILIFCDVILPFAALRTIWDSKKSLPDYGMCFARIKKTSHTIRISGAIIVKTCWKIGREKKLNLFTATSV